MPWNCCHTSILQTLAVGLTALILVMALALLQLGVPQETTTSSPSLSPEYGYFEISHLHPHMGGPFASLPAPVCTPPKELCASEQNTWISARGIETQWLWHCELAGVTVVIKTLLPTAVPAWCTSLLWEGSTCAVTLIHPLVNFKKSPAYFWAWPSYSSGCEETVVGLRRSCVPCREQFVGGRKCVAGA